MNKGLFSGGASAIAICAGVLTFSGSAMAQVSASESPQELAAKSEATGDEIVVTGIRASLQRSLDIKREGQGVVDAISAEDIGKFPDTNLAESLQRITGVSIDRSNGEGSFVTVRGFGPEFNLVTLNGRQMPTASLGDGGSAPSSRSFDFANLASEGVSGVQVYKTGRASVASGGIGSTINILSPRPLDKPGFYGSLGVKGVYDTSQNGKNDLTPEFSGIVSKTFADDTIGVLLTASYQRRKGGNNGANVSWRDGYLGDENNWGSLATPGDPRYANITNRPEATDVYQVPQSAAYDIVDVDRERINGQAVIQFRPVDNLTATADFTYSRNKVEISSASGGIWFNHNDTSSSWTDGPVAGPIFYSENFLAREAKDTAFTDTETANQTENKSFGFNLAWEPSDRLSFGLDLHHSTAESKPTNKYGTSVAVAAAIFGVANQSVNFDNDLPLISLGLNPGLNYADPSLMTPSGNAFRNAYFRDRINQAQFSGKYDVDDSFLDSIDFGVSYTDNKVRSAFGVIQNNSWGGAGPASDIPDDVFSLVDISNAFPGVSGNNSPDRIQQIIRFDFPRFVSLIDDLYNACGGTGNCLADYTTDRRIREKTIAPYVQLNSKFDLFNQPAHLTAGVRYEKTTINSSALVPIPTSTSWVAANEFAINFGPDSDFTTVKGGYSHWLPSVDFDFRPLENVVLRASVSKTITRPDYASMQGGLTLDQQFSINGGGGSRGNPGLLPYSSKNLDFSAEWYYGNASYISAGFFLKKVKNFIASDRVEMNAFGLVNPGSGPRYDAAIAALGPNAPAVDIRQYIFDNYPASTIITGIDVTGYTTGQILGLPADDPLVLRVNTPVNSDQTATIHGFEFAIQHNFWDTGFGTILNYTLVNGDATYDNKRPSTVTQFALTGLSDSANAVLFYDKNGIQARVAYNWRAKFLSGGGPNPTYVEDYGQIDASASWEFKPGLTAFVEGINLTGSSRRLHQRSERNVTYASPGFARYAAGVRFSF